MEETRPLHKFYWISAAFALMIGTPAFFGTALLYRGNVDELRLALIQIYEFILPYLLLATLAFGIGGSFLSEKNFRRIFAGFTALSLGFYLQGYFFLTNYGRFAGGQLQWSRHRTFGIFEAIVWLSIIGAFLYFSRSRFQYFKKLLIFLTFAQFLQLAYNSVSFGRMWAYKEAPKHDDSIYQFSESKNILVILLDAFQSTAFDRILEESPEIKNDFQGFTYFQDHMAAYKSTFMSIPAILSGRANNNKKSIDNYFQEFTKYSVTNEFKAAGYGVDMITIPRYCSYLPQTNCYGQGIAERDSSARRKSAVSRTFSLVAFRFLPHFLKKYLYDHYQKLTSKENFGIGAWWYNWHERAFQLTQNFEEFASAKPQPPTFKFLHLLLPHRPIIRNENCEFVSEGTNAEADQYLAQGRCALHLVSRILKVLKDLKIYDSTTVVVTADHGMGIPYQKLAPELKGATYDFAEITYPLLLIKPAHSQTSFQINSAPSWVIDLPKTLLSAAELPAAEKYPGENLLSTKPLPPRERLFYWTSEAVAPEFNGDYLPPLETYGVKGQARDRKNWKLLSRQGPSAAAKEYTKLVPP